MSASKDINRYTSMWGELFDEFNAYPEREHRIQCATVREAEKIRLEFYKARAAQGHADEKTRADGLKSGLPLSHILNSTYPNLDKKEVRLEGTTVVFGYKEASRVAELIKASLEDPANKVHEDDTPNP